MRLRIEEVTKAALGFYLGFAPDAGLKGAWLDPDVGGARFALLGGKVEAQVQLAAEGGALVFRVLKVREKVLGSIPVAAGIWKPQVQQAVRALILKLPPQYSLALLPAGDGAALHLAGLRIVGVLVGPETLRIELARA